MMWRSLVIEDHEPGVDRDREAGFGFGRLHGVGVTADVVVGFEHRHIMMRVQEVGAAQSGDAGTNDGEARAG